MPGKIQRMMSIKSSDSSLERFGFSSEHGSAHMARTMMYKELDQLLDYVSAPSSASDAYTRAIENDNCLSKRSGRTRTLTRQHLVDLYALDPDITIFRILRYFWKRDPEGRPLLSCLCAYARDQLMRTSASFILRLSEGKPPLREAFEDYLEKKYPGRFSRATLKSTTRNLASSWTQSGHLTGRVKKIRSRPLVTTGAVAYALFLGFLSGERRESLFHTEYAKLLDSSFEKIAELAECASRKGWIIFKRVGNVIEVLFPALLTAQEMEWIREQD